MTLCLANAIIDEYVDVLTRMGLGGTSELGELLALFRTGHGCLFTTQTPSLSIASDPDDNTFLEAAVALDADAIVSGDKHLKEIRRYAGIDSASPRGFLEKHT